MIEVVVVIAIVSVLTALGMGVVYAILSWLIAVWFASSR